MLLPNMNDGRFFISPILGCSGACSYCYLGLHDYTKTRKNGLTVETARKEALKCPNFVSGEKGTIVSVGAWGDIFPLDREDLIIYSVNYIKDLLSWGNPMQIMSKNSLKQELVEEITSAVRYPGQLLYSTTITTLDHWQKIEPCTSSPLERLNTCSRFHEYGIPTNVLLKPFIPQMTGVEIEQISDALLKYKIDYCTVGILYLDEKIANRISKNPVIKDLITDLDIETNHLDCDGNAQLNATGTKKLMTYVEFLKKKGIRSFLKSSCVNANVLRIKNQSNYYEDHNSYCIDCGNCERNKLLEESE